MSIPFRNARNADGDSRQVPWLLQLCFAIHPMQCHHVSDLHTMRLIFCLEHDLCSSSCDKLEQNVPECMLISTDDMLAD